MVKITKVPLPKHEETLSPWIRDFVEAASTTSLPLLPQQLAKFPSRWPFPRDDLYHWIPLLNRFDTVLEDFCTLYGLHDGPQIRNLTCELLQRGSEASQSLEELGYGEDGDRQVVESVLDFSKMLLENCGNRTIYASSPLLSDLLNSTSLSLVSSTLQIGTQLAQRYQASFKRLSAPYRQHNSALLAIHYNINLDRVQQLAQPFIRTSVSTESVASTTPATPSTKGKEKAYFSGPASNKTSVTTVYANDLVSIARGGPLSSSGVNGHRPAAASTQASSTELAWDDWGDVRVIYYDNQPQSEQDGLTLAPINSSSASPSAPPTPTPIRRSSTLGHQHGQRTSRLASTDESPTSTARAPVVLAEETPSSKPKVIEIPSAKVLSAPIHELLKENMSLLPKESKYELLNKLRVAKALTSSVESRRQLLTVRILAITNLAYIHAESAFLEKVLKQDGDEPRRLQLIYQLADMIHPPADGQVPIPRALQTMALSGLEALAAYQSKFSDICIALNTNINHGVLLYVIRKAVAEMAVDEIGDKVTEKDEWRGAVFSLLSHVATLPRAGSDMVTAGLVPILVDVLKLRTTIAERSYPMILDFLDAFIFNVRDAFQILVAADGLGAITDLIIQEVKSASESANANEGMQPEFRSQPIDYEIPYFKQQSLKRLFKFIHHMMSNAGVYGGNFDRLLRNLIDNSQLLVSLREIIGHANCFGSSVWTYAVRILNDFINNEPTSFAVLAEAGLSRELLKAVTGTEVKMLDEPRESQPQTDASNDATSPAQTDDESLMSFLAADETPHPPTAEMLETPRTGVLARGIIPSSEAITIIPAAFGAICLNSSGMRMFQSTTALQSFFEIFESPKHVQCMENDGNLASNLGATFDELVRHYPPLKTSIMNATLDMVARVAYLCKGMVSETNNDAKLWPVDTHTMATVADGSGLSTPSSLTVQSKGKAKATSSDVDIEMTGVANDSGESAENQQKSDNSEPTSPTPYIFVVATFLSTMFSNSSVRAAFMEKGGVEYVLDLAELSSLPANFENDKASRIIHNVISILAEQKPHLVLPSLVKRVQAATEVLAPFSQHSQQEVGTAYFAQLVKSEPANLSYQEMLDRAADGTRLAKAFVKVNSLTRALTQCLQAPLYNSHRSSNPSFTTINLTDYYVQFVKALGPLLIATIKEKHLIFSGGLVPANWENALRNGDHAYPFGSDSIDGLKAAESRSVITDATTGIETVATGDPTKPPAIAGEKTTGSASDLQVVTKKEKETNQFKNFKTLRSLFDKIPRILSTFFQSIGRVSVSKRYPEPMLRQSHGSIPEALAETMILLLSSISNEKTRANYDAWHAVVETLKDTLVGPSRQGERPFEVITAVVHAFKERGGFSILNDLLKEFTDDIRQIETSIEHEKHAEESFALGYKLGFVTATTKHILHLYLLVVTGKNIMEASQTSAMTSRSERDRTKTEFFSAPQFLVELRMCVLPTVRRLWESDIVEKANSEIPNKLIDIIRVIAMADHEGGAYKRQDKPQLPVKTARKTWKPNAEHLAKLIELGSAEDLAKEALFRCNNSHNLAWEYCKAQNSVRSGGRNPIPEQDFEPTPEVNGSSTGQTAASTSTSTPTTSEPPPLLLGEPITEAASVGTTVDQTMAPPSVPDEPMARDLQNLLTGIGRNLEDATAANGASPVVRDVAASPSHQSMTSNGASSAVIVTVDDLDEERAAIRDQLIERCLDVINAHGEVTFEIADLITTVVEKSEDPSGMRKDMGETLVNALMSFGGEDDIREVGKKVAAYAHLLALMLQNKDFYNASIASLKGNLENLINFVKLAPTHSSEEASPWVAHILLIIETLLVEDAQPQETTWKFPTIETAIVDEPVLKFSEKVVSVADRTMLFNNIVEILPRIGKDESLALAVLRIMVILTRARNIALAMGKKKNIQRLFVMMKQLAGITNARLQSSLMLILRHIIEDDETVKQVMRAEIKTFFDQPRNPRNVDVSTYLRSLSHLIIRNPVLFAEATKEMVKLSKWSPSSSESPGRQQVVLQDVYQQTGRGSMAGTVLPPLQATGSITLNDIKPTTEAIDKEAAEASKPATAEHKAPVIENPDGVIHFLLCELLNYKDVEDKDATLQPNEKPVAESSSGDADAVMTEAGKLSNLSNTADGKDPKKSAKQEFKAEEHPIYIYRCYLLQCLAELLYSYNRTKIEFINFKRSAPPLPNTPSKPRSSVVNYLLSDLIPIGTLDHVETISLRKRLATSSWADRVLTALLSKTGEQIVIRDRDPLDGEDEPDLLHVRKFVLENILKAYKDASSSSEPLDVRYARMLSLSDLMTHIMESKAISSNPSDPSTSVRSNLQQRRVMFEKGFIAALTGSIADIDLNFPGAKRAVKHILRPLKTLTQTAVELSAQGKISLAPGQAEEDEIASASSVSDLDDMREETPDLFRNSTLGMFEPGRDNNSSSDSEDDDEDMYEAEYDEEGIEYEEEMAEDDEENISDEDEDLEGMGEIEGLSGDHAVGVELIMEDDDDDDGDEDDDPSDEDDEEDSDDMDEDDEDAHIEIVDEDGNIHPLGEDDNGEEWQSEDDEEEEYEGRDADEEEEHVHDMDHIARGAIGHLVRALGGDDHDGAVEILQRMEDEGMEEEQMELEGYLEDGQDEDEDEEDDEDMDDDDGLYDDYPVAPPGMAFEWNGEAVEPPLPMIVSHRGHRPRHGIPGAFGYFPAGARDPLGGMFDPLPQLQNLLEMEFRAADGIGHAQTALSAAHTEMAGGDVVGNALSTARSALEEARARLTALQGFVAGAAVRRAPPNFSTNALPVPDLYRGFSPYRSHRPGPTPRGNDDGMNPLLHRSLGASLAVDPSNRPDRMAGALAALRRDGLLLPDIPLGGTRALGEGPAALWNDLITSLPLPGSIVSRNGHQLHFQFTTNGPQNDMTRDLQALFGVGRALTRHDGRREATIEPGHAAFFNLRPTAARWTEEAKLLFGNLHQEKSYQRVLSGTMAVLIPPALKAEMDARKLAEELKKKRDEEERLAKEAKEKKEAEDKAEKEKKEAEEHEAAEKARAEAAAAAGLTSDGSLEDQQVPPTDSASQAMQGVQTTGDDAAPAAVEELVPAGERPRVTTMIRGRQVDITDLGIDAEFLQGLPEDLREEVITSEVAVRRSQAAATGAEPSEIDQEFLDALPAEIRDEIIQQERQERRRRDREEHRRQQAANGSAAPAAAPQEMDAASILATLPPALRQQVLMEQDEEILAHLPAEFIAQARAGMRDLPLSHVRNMAAGRARAVAALGGVEQAMPKPQRLPIIQMLDKAGVATLLRLMFVFQQESLQVILYQVLENISQNRHNRSEVISTLLHILQDGSTDMGAVERSFAHLSLRAKQPKDKEPKTPQPLKRTLTGMSLNIVTNTDVSPLMVVQQCLLTLIHLSNVNPHVPSFFLTEHESIGGLKRTASRKGKGKDTRASKFALNSLLTLLDRKLIMESSSVMESLSGLLSKVTLPLQNLEKRQKEAADEAKKVVEDPSVADTAASAATATTVTTEQLPESMDTDLVATSEPTINRTIDEATGTPVPVIEEPEKPVATEAKGTETKKVRPFIAPIIPEASLKLVINIFVARECSANTFRETLSTIKNLSGIPGAKAIFGKELILKAQDLGEIILLDLDDLLPQIEKASTGTEIQGVALAKFSPPSSDQNKLLRVLTALDHLFEPKTAPKRDLTSRGDATNGEAGGEHSKDAEKQDLLATLYENSTFGPMWEKLSACLSAIRQREHMLNVATILLPLIESLMVVCKNTTLKEAPTTRSQISREMSLTSPPPESRMENLFFTFTEEHRKILNDLVRHTPKLMSGTFSLLVKNPKVLEFDNKRNYFTRSIHNRSQARQSFQPLQLSVRRDLVFHDSFKSLYFKTGDEMKFGKLSIRFHGEEGVDAGGVTREWFQVLSRQMFDPGYALFVPVSSDRTTFHPNHMSAINEEHLMFFKFIGRVIGKALYEGRVLDCHFSRAVYKRILGKAVSVKDMESLDPEYYKSLVWMLENDITDIISETFSVDHDMFGVVETVDLIENGRNILVTQENKIEYVRLMVEFKLTGSVQEQLDNFLTGFHEIIPAELVAIFNEQELELLISGLPEIDVDDWKSNTEYHNFSGASPQIQWFWRAVRSFDKEERAKLLQFVTGTSKVPLNGFKELEGMNGFSRFNIHRDYGNKDRLPSSHTCFNQLDLPEYESYEALRQQVLTAITAGSEYFGFA